MAPSGDSVTDDEEDVGSEMACEETDPLLDLGFDTDHANPTHPILEIDSRLLDPLKDNAESRNRLAFPTSTTAKDPDRSLISTPSAPVVQKLDHAYFERKRAEKSKRARQTQAEKERNLARHNSIHKKIDELISQNVGLPNIPIKEEETQESPQGNSENILADLDAMETEEEDITSFTEVVRAYELKKRSGQDTTSDRIGFLKAQNAHEKLIQERKRMDQAAREEDNEMYGDMSDDNLFLNSDEDRRNVRPPPAKKQKKTKPNNSKGKNKRAQASAEEINQSMNVAVSASTSANSSKKGPGRNSKARGREGQVRSKPSGSKKTKVGGSRGRYNKSLRPVNCSSQFRSSSSFYQTADIRSLHNSDVFATSEANSTAGTLPSLGLDRMTKREALEKLVASISNEKGPDGKRDLKVIEDASKKLTHFRSIKPMEHGWLITGMTQPLKHFQLLGLSRMRELERDENDANGIHGGIIADSMGLGKTITMIANLIDGKPPPDSPRKATLIVVPPALMLQWESEIKNHCEPHVFPSVWIYRSKEVPRVSDVKGLLKSFDIVITSYNEVSKSYPKYKPPLELSDEGEKAAWWAKEYESRGVLHVVPWYRVVCDECQQMKNYHTHTAIAVCGLIAEYRWLMSGTIITNDITEFYSLFSFLRVPQTGSFDLFEQNFLADHAARKRLNLFLPKIMIRRTHSTKLLDKPILTLPPARQHTTPLKFTKLEQKIYDIVLKRCRTSIKFQKKYGTTRQLSFHALVRLLLLRQITGHIFCGAPLLVQILYKADIKEINEVCKEAERDHETPKEDLATLKEMFAEIEQNSAEVPEHCRDEIRQKLGKSFGLKHTRVGGFFKEVMKEIPIRDEILPIHEPHVCFECEQEPEECQQLTPCGHHICKACVDQLHFSATVQEMDTTTCSFDGCNAEITGQKYCDGPEEMQRAPWIKKKEREVQRQRLHDWLQKNNSPYASTKTKACKAAILRWKEEDPSVKIIIYTQFLDMVEILSRMCQIEDWGYAQFHGGIKWEAKAKTVKVFQESRDKNILIATLRTGGVGLNLTQATRVLLVDIYWNSAMEQQAFCRVYRIGQEKPTMLHRLVMNESVDQHLLAMQIRKDRRIGEALNDRTGKGGKPSVEELMEIFGISDHDDEEDVRGHRFTLPTSALRR